VLKKFKNCSASIPPCASSVGSTREKLLPNLEIKIMLRERNGAGRGGEGGKEKEGGDGGHMYSPEVEAAGQHRRSG
jgi:hypothetical protein